LSGQHVFCGGMWRRKSLEVGCNALLNNEYQYNILRL
jgi:hypothetical protein